MLVSEPVLTS